METRIINVSSLNTKLMYKAMHSQSSFDIMKRNWQWLRVSNFEEL
jgi:hypothetical protein